MIEKEKLTLNYFTLSFRIALRRISAPDDEVQSSMESFKETGFINYYGLQRFGNHAAIPTHRIGLALLKADYKQVRLSSTTIDPSALFSFVIPHVHSGVRADHAAARE